MGELQSAVDALAADDLHSLSGPELLTRTGELLVLRNRIDAELTRTVREVDVVDAAEHDGLRTTASWLRGHGHLTPSAATRLVAAGRALEHLPAVAAAFADGAVTADQVTLIAPVASEEHRAAASEQDIDLAEVDRTLAVTAAASSPRDVAQVVHHYLERLDPDGTEPDPTEGRRLTIARHADGSVTGRFDLDAVGGEKVQAALESIAQADRPEGDARSRAQQLADAFVQLADNALAHGDLPTLRTRKPQVGVLIGIDDVVDGATGHGTATLSFGAQISAARARMLACDGEIARIIIGPEGQPLEMGRTHRVVPPHLRKAVEVRDSQCVFAGCGAPKYWCDVHHILHWLFGGETNLENSALLCERHHTRVHHGFRVERDPGGRWHTYRPDDTEIVVGSPLLV